MKARFLASVLMVLCSAAQASEPDMKATLTAYFSANGAPLTIDASKGWADFATYDRSDSRIQQYWQRISRDSNGGYVLLQSSVRAPSAWDKIMPPLNLALAIGSVVAPEIMPASLALAAVGGYFDSSAIDAIGGGSDPIIPPQLSHGIGEAMPYINTANLIRNGINFALTLGPDEYDRSAGARGELTIDRSGPIDEAVLEFLVDTHEGDPIGWIRSAPVAPGGSMASPEGTMIRTERIVDLDSGSHLKKIRLHVYPQRIPVGTYDLVFSSKETDCQGCLSIVQSLRIKIIRTCVAEGLAQTIDPSFHVTGCQRCSMFERIGPTSVQSYACVSCGPGGYQDPSNVRSCLSCTGNQVMRVTNVPFAWVPHCETCATDTRPNSARSACIPNVCYASDLGESAAAPYRPTQHLGQARCEDFGPEIGAQWSIHCAPDQYRERSRCFYCPAGQIGGFGRASCRVPVPSPGMPPVTAPVGTVTSASCNGVAGTVSDQDTLRFNGRVVVEAYVDGPHPRFTDGTRPAGRLVAQASVANGGGYQLLFVPGLPAGPHHLWVYALDNRFPGWARLLGDPWAKPLMCNAPGPMPIFTAVPLPIPTRRPVRPVFPRIPGPQ